MNHHGETESSHVQRQQSTVALQSLRTFSVKTIKLLQLIATLKSFRFVTMNTAIFIFHLSCKLKIATLNQKCSFGTKKIYKLLCDIMTQILIVLQRISWDLDIYFAQLVVNMLSLLTDSEVQNDRKKVIYA